MDATNLPPRLNGNLGIVEKMKTKTAQRMMIVINDVKVFGWFDWSRGICSLSASQVVKVGQLPVEWG